MKAGVRSSPCAVESTPARAAPSVAFSANPSTKPPHPLPFFGWGWPATLAPAASVSAFRARVCDGSVPMECRFLHGAASVARSQDEHRVAERVEAVPLLDRELV